MGNINETIRNRYRTPGQRATESEIRRINKIRDTTFRYVGNIRRAGGNAVDNIDFESRTFPRRVYLGLSRTSTWIKVYLIGEAVFLSVKYEPC